MQFVAKQIPIKYTNIGTNSIKSFTQQGIVDINNAYDASVSELGTSGHLNFEVEMIDILKNLKHNFLPRWRNEW